MNTPTTADLAQALERCIAAVDAQRSALYAALGVTTERPAHIPVPPELAGPLAEAFAAEAAARELLARYRAAA